MIIRTVAAVLATAAVAVGIGVAAAGAGAATVTPGTTGWSSGPSGTGG
jgi:hypothetical protein